MGLTESLIGSAGQFIGSIIGGIFRSIGNIAGSFVAKKIRAPEKWETINVNDEEKKVSFRRSGDGGYFVMYDTKEVGQISRFETKGYEGKSENAVMYHIIYKLEVLHQYFKNRELAMRTAKKLYADYKDYMANLPKKK